MIAHLLLSPGFSTVYRSEKFRETAFVHVRELRSVAGSIIVEACLLQKDSWVFLFPFEEVVQEGEGNRPESFHHRRCTLFQVDEKRPLDVSGDAR
jgi:hypothetical protein